MSNSSQEPMTWMIFALLSVSMWGLYGVLLHKGVHAMADPDYGRYKAYLFVGIAYFIFAVAAPAIWLWFSNSDWTFPGGGMFWSIVAGTAGAIGAFGILLAFGAGGRPAIVMPIVFAGAPILTACVAITIDQTWGQVRWPFFLGIVIAATGATMVLVNRPAPPPADAHKPEPAVAPATEAAEAGGSDATDASPTDAATAGSSADGSDHRSS